MFELKKKKDKEEISTAKDSLPLETRTYIALKRIDYNKEQIVLE